MLICFCASCIAQATSQAGTDDGLIVAQARAAKAARDYDAVLRLLAGTKSADGLWLKAWVFAHRSEKAAAAAAFRAFVTAARPGDARLTEARAALTRLGVPDPAPQPAPTPANAGSPTATVPAAATETPKTAPQPAAPPAEPLPVSAAASPSVLVPSLAPVQLDPLVRLQELIYNAPVRGIPERLGGGVMVKYKVRLEDGSEKGLKTVFKPRQTGGQSFTYEIAAYRIDRLCRMGHVPVTVKRALPRSLLAQVGGSGLGRVIASGDVVGGSLQQWVNDAKDPFGMRARGWVEGWLRRLECLDGKVSDLAGTRQASNLLLLDYLQGNMDRYSGGNILEDANGKLWFIDNSEAFSSSTRPRRDFDRVKRFDRKVIDALRQATDDDFAREVGPWITQAELRALLERRLHVLERVDTIVTKYGRGNTCL